MSAPKHVFYHADRYASLKEGEVIELNGNKLSRFGQNYWPVFQTVPFDQMNESQKREFVAEKIKQQPRYQQYTSRMQCLFAANTIAEAIVFANEIIPKPAHPIPIIEIFADKFWSLDMNWLDYGSGSTESFYYYWDGVICNHRPVEGERRPPRLEVLIALPATTGKVIHIVE